MRTIPRIRSSSVEVQAAYERVLADTSVGSNFIEVGAGGRIHLLEKGDGPPLVLLHGTTASAGFFVPVLNELDGIRALAPDRPGHGLSDPIELPRDRFREAVVEWLDQLLDTLDVDAPALLGHSGGGIWALWYALARPDRVRRLVLIAPPALPGTRCPLPIRLMATPGLGELMSRLAPPSPKSMLRFAKFMGEQQTLARHPELVDLFVATGRNPTADRVARAESTRPGVTLRLVVAFRVPTSCTCPPRDVARARLRNEPPRGDAGRRRGIPVARDRFPAAAGPDRTVLRRRARRAAGGKAGAGAVDGVTIPSRLRCRGWPAGCRLAGIRGRQVRANALECPARRGVL